MRKMWVLVAQMLLFLLIQDNMALVPKAKLEIVKNHNKFRANVRPEAADMLNMVSQNKNKLIIF